MGQLRNRKHEQCFYRVVETRVEVWENKKCFANTEEKGKQLVDCDYQKCTKFSLFTPSLLHQLVLVLCFYRVLETRLLPISACVFLALFSNVV